MKKSLPVWSCLFALVFLPAPALQAQRLAAHAHQLSAKEKKQGWQSLFNGRNLDGWHTYQQKPGSWSVANGLLYCQEVAGEQYADLVSANTYAHFELAIDWKIEALANSGILYLVTEEYPQSYLSGPEYQLLDDEGYAGKVMPNQLCGANYAMQAPAARATRPVGEWNHTLIRVKNRQVEHWLNGKKVVAYTLGSAEWKQEKANSKWKDAPGYGMSAKGHIALQDFHGKGKVWFRNILIRPLNN